VYEVKNKSSVEIYVLSYKWRGDKLYFNKELDILDKSDIYQYGKKKKVKKKKLKI
tara:strand:- start:5 stop:169 length:165 start_codon:yes stop_codon:yes gene_type:complete